MADAAAAAAAAAAAEAAARWWEPPFRPHSTGPLTPEATRHFWEEGWVCARGLLTRADLAPSLDAIEQRVDGVAQRLLTAGVIKDAAADADVFTRLIRLEQQFDEASVLVHKDGSLPPAFASLWSHPRLLAVASQLLGPHIAGHPSWNCRAKTPRLEAGVVPFHQDAAYNAADSRQTLQLTAWIPLLDVTAQHGCMQVVPRTHLTGRTADHTCAWRSTWYLQLDEAHTASSLLPHASGAPPLPTSLADAAVTVDMRAGDVLLFNSLVVHRSLDNTSDVVRWSLDLRWQAQGEPDGAFGLKQPIPMTPPPGTPAAAAAGAKPWVIPWEGWADVDKKSGSAGGLAAADEAAGADPELSTIIVGPWLDLWPETNSNKHTRAWRAWRNGGAEAWG